MKIKNKIQYDGILFYTDCNNFDLPKEKIDFNNLIIERARKFLKTQCPGIVNNLNYELYFYDSEEINACTYLEKNNAIIAFPKNLFSDLYENIKTLFSLANILEMFSLSENDKDGIKSYIDAVFDYTVFFIALHEISHISRGHCGYIKTLSCTNEMKKLHFQTVEGDADYFATKILVNYILWITRDLVIDEKIEKDDQSFLQDEIKLLFFAMYNLFLFFWQADKTVKFSFLLDNFLVDDHPFPGIRFINSEIYIFEYLSNYIDYDTLSRISYELQGICIKFDNYFSAYNKFEKTMFAIASTEKGAMHMKRLNINFNEIISQLQKYATVTLEKKDIPSKMPYWVDEYGNMSTEMYYTSREKNKA